MLFLVSTAVGAAPRTLLGRESERRLITRRIGACIDRLAARFSKENGPNSETAQRAEEASVAIRRLERALLQREIQRISAGQGAVGVCDETE